VDRRSQLDAWAYGNLEIGPPASAKTLFLLGIIEYKKGVYFDGSNTTNRILDVLEEKWTIPIVLMLATGILTALAAHNPAYLYGFGLGKNAGLRG
jgi:hypothetical protein